MGRNALRQTRHYGALWRFHKLRSRLVRQTMIKLLRNLLQDAFICLAFLIIDGISNRTFRQTAERFAGYMCGQCLIGITLKARALLKPQKTVE
jgi:hypothetical protein